jgi:uncharacterized protein YaiL (DUF2058 family)
MAGSLFDQLKQAGLVDDKKAKQVKREKYQQIKQGKGKKGKQPQAKPDDAAALAARAAQDKAEGDRQLNRERQQLLAEKAERAALRQMIEANRLSDYAGERTHHFTDDGKVKTLYVNDDTHARLSVGSIRIAQFDDGYALVSAATAEKIAQRDANALIPLPEGDAALSDEDREYYAKFEVPDDLSW